MMKQLTQFLFIGNKILIRAIIFLLLFLNQFLIEWFYSCLWAACDRTSCIRPHNLYRFDFYIPFPWEYNVAVDL